ncbi:hypothetical protein CFBP1573P_01153 [Pseudomonas syringae pv. persicae]|uniref:Uncharacterized protein n=1 Tax=Pseudomonas syringae pv. persicae TaxID=237306 RepID=A0AB38EA71_9PSED|nr:hypothetical protein NCPPB2254_00862 [Pseudomonas syringae pv. persicae]SOQ06854.1 hypothetical protein CFBP1573P_01153 [Pseudomonas syringae pv. persicae]
MALTGQHFNFHRLLLGQHIGSSKPPVLPRGVNSRLALGGHFYSGGDKYFAAHGEPEPNFRRINPSDPAYTPVINFTNQTYEQLQKAKQAKGSAKRRMETAVRALMAYRGEAIEAPRQAFVRRANASGETLQ